MLALPLLLLGVRVANNQLGPEPAEYLVHYLGEWALYILFFTLSVSPLNRLFRKLGLVRYRRMVGLWCLAYAFLHSLAYPVFLADWANLVEDLVQRPYIIVGALALVVLVVLGVTSPQRMVRRMGRRWKSVHRGIYAVLFLVLLHVWWQVRSDYTDALVYTCVAVVLMYYRRVWLRQFVFSTLRSS